jgi:hypothetical protein
MQYITPLARSLTNGSLFAVQVQPANIQDNHGAVPLLKSRRRERGRQIACGCCVALLLLLPMAAPPAQAQQVSLLRPLFSIVGKVVSRAPSALSGSTRAEIFANLSRSSAFLNGLELSARNRALLTELQVAIKAAGEPRIEEVVTRQLQVSHAVEFHITFTRSGLAIDQGGLPPGIFESANEQAAKLVNDAVGRVPIQAFQSEQVLRAALLDEIEVLTAKTLKSTTEMTFDRASGRLVIRVGTAVVGEVNVYAVTSTLAGSILCDQVVCSDNALAPPTVSLTQQPAVGTGLTRVQLRELNRRRRLASGGVEEVFASLLTARAPEREEP